MTTALVTVALVHLLLGIAVALRTAGGTAPTDRPAKASTPPEAVCLLAVRNEEENIVACLDALAAQSSGVAVVVVDDHSEDATREQIQTRPFGRVRVVEGGPGKALALQTGFDVTSQEIVLTTDADCRPPPGWAEAMAKVLYGSNLGAVGGPTMVLQRGVVSKLEALDWSILLSVAAAISHRGRPVTAMGNNMALTRQALTHIGGFQRGAVSLTEDYVIFREVGVHYETRLLLEPEFLNWTEPLNSLKEIFRQRKRWAIGGAAGPSTNAAIAALGLVAYAAPWAVLAFSPLLGAGLLVARWLVHAGIALALAERLRIRLPLAWIPLHDLLMTVYAVLIPLTLPFSRRTRWKNRVLTQVN